MLRRAPLPLPFFRTFDKNTAECKTFAEDTFQNFLSGSLTLKVLNFNQTYFVVLVVKMLFQFALSDYCFSNGSEWLSQEVLQVLFKHSIGF